jgi:hypothetical protein
VKVHWAATGWGSQASSVATTTPMEHAQRTGGGYYGRWRARNGANREAWARMVEETLARAVRP